MEGPWSTSSPTPRAPLEIRPESPESAASSRKRLSVSGRDILSVRTVLGAATNRKEAQRSGGRGRGFSATRRPATQCGRGNRRERDDERRGTWRTGGDRRPARRLGFDVRLSESEFDHDDVSPYSGVDLRGIADEHGLPDPFPSDSTSTSEEKSKEKERESVVQASIGHLKSTLRVG